MFITIESWKHLEGRLTDKNSSTSSFFAARRCLLEMVSVLVAEQYTKDSDPLYCDLVRLQGGTLLHEAGEPLNCLTAS